MIEEKIRVCKFIREFPQVEEITHGRGPTFYFLSKEQVKHGMNIHVICTSKSKKEEDVLNDGIHIHKVPSPFDFYSLKKFKVLNNEDTIDVVHNHSTSGLGYALFRKAVGRKPLIVHVHHIRRGAKGISISDSLVDSLRNKFWTYVSLIRQDLIWKRADALITVSKTVAKDLNEIYRIPQYKIHVVYNGVDPSVFKPIMNNQNLIKNLKIEGKNVILYVGDFGLRKGLKYLIESIPAVIKEFPDTMFLLIGGTPKWLGTDIYWQMLTEQIQKLQIQNYVKLMSEIQHLELPKFYSISDLLILPSLYEGFGKVLVEAMACEKPVIATNVGGIPEVISNGEDGILIPPRRSDHIANSIIELLSNRKKMKEMGEKGRQNVLRKFTWQLAAKETLLIYKQLLTKQI